MCARVSLCVEEGIRSGGRWDLKSQTGEHFHRETDINMMMEVWSGGRERIIILTKATQCP